MGTTNTCRRLRPPSAAAARPPSPNLTRSRSGASSISLPESFNASFSSSSTSSSSTNSGKRVLISRSQSETRSSSTAAAAANKFPARNSVSRSENNSLSRDAFARLLEQRGSPRNYASSRGVKSATSSPSAWALSPGRVSTKKTTSSPSSMCMTPPESPVSAARMRAGGSGGGSGRVTGVLKYFKQKKVSPVEEEDYHRFRVLQNRLLQWRFVNARTEAALANLKVNAEYQLFWVWLRIYKMRNYVVENLIEVQRLHREIKLHEIVSLQLPLLNEWAKLDAKNCEALSKLTRKLHALSVRLPLVHGGKADMMSMYEAMAAAIEVMDETDEIIIVFLPQVEKILYQLTELLSMFEQELLCFEEVEKSIALIPKLTASESSLRVHLIQKAKE